MKIAYFDCFADASGDMILGALLDAGLEVNQLTAELVKLKLSHFNVNVRKVQKKGINGSQALVDIDQEHHGHHHRRLSDILEILQQSDLDEWVRQKSAAIFQRLADAEARVQRLPVDEVHFHEVGAMDAIIDVVGSVAGIRLLELEEIIYSALHVGSGTVVCAHGTLPVPAPASSRTGPSSHSTAARCSSFSLAESISGIVHRRHAVSAIRRGSGNPPTSSKILMAGSDARGECTVEPASAPTRTSDDPARVRLASPSRRHARRTRCVSLGAVPAR